jgi:hypothetical protein
MGISTMGGATLANKGTTFFQDEGMNFCYLWVLGYQGYGGAALGECLAAGRRIKDGNCASWAQAWSQVAVRLETQAATVLAKGHPLGARTTYLRACMYYRTATICMSPQDAGWRATLGKVTATFRQMAALSAPPIEVVAVPFEGRALPGYFMPVPGSGKRPTLIAVGGSELLNEELYLWAGAPGVERGYNVLFVDLPGQDSTPFGGLFVRTDAEAPIRAIVDYALSRPEVDGDHLAAYGIGSGGYMALRAAVFEPRIKACVANPPIVDLSRLLSADLPPALLKAAGLLGGALLKGAGLVSPVLAVTAQKLLWQMGESDISRALEKARAATIAQRLPEVSCPVLCLVSEGEATEQKRQVRQAYDALRAPKALRVFTEAEGAEAHCQVNNLSLSHRVMFDWLDDTFGRATPGQGAATGTPVP